MNTQSARKVSEFATILTRNANGTAREIVVPGHEGRHYRVILRREAGGMTTECLQDLGRLGEQPCRGNANGHVCYHSLAAILKAAEEAKHKLAFCDDESAARRLARLGGKVLSIKSRQGHGQALAIVR